MQPSCNLISLSNILHSPKHKLTFISNPKVACSTIKNSLLGGFEGNVHKKAGRKFKLPEDINHEFFCLTRNPYSRALSCFKNKIGPSKEKNPNAVWHPFCNRFRFNRIMQPSFEDFLKALLEDNDPLSMDMHYRPQHFNLHQNDIEPSFIGRIENFTDVEDYLLDKHITIISRNKHKTGSSKTYRDEITDDNAKLIEKFYEKDFDLYGYEKDLKDNFVPPTVVQMLRISHKYQGIFCSAQQDMEATT